VPAQALSFGLFLFCYYAHAGTWSTYATLFFADHGMTIAQIGVLMSMIQVLRIVGPNVWGYVADHYDRRVLVLRLAGFAALAGFSGFFFGSRYAHFLLAMVVLNLFTSGQAPICEALMISEMKGDLTYYGRIRMWGSVGFIVAVTLASLALERYGIVTLPWIAAALLVATILAAFRLRDVPRRTHKEAPPPLLSLLRRREVIAFFASTFLMLAAHAAIYAYYSLYLEGLGYSNSVIGMMWSLGVVAEIVFFFFQAPLFRRFGVKSLMLASLALAVLRFLMIGLGAASLTVLLVAQVMHAATFGIHNSASVATMQRWFAGPLQARGQALFVSISYGLGGTLGSLAFSLAWEQISPGVVFVLAAACAAAGLVAAWLSYRWAAMADA